VSLNQPTLGHPPKMIRNGSIRYVFRLAKVAKEPIIIGDIRRTVSHDIVVNAMPKLQLGRAASPPLPGRNQIPEFFQLHDRTLLETYTSATPLAMRMKSRAPTRNNHQYPIDTPARSFILRKYVVTL
jgi:hypothetical protein